MLDEQYHIRERCKKKQGKKKLTNVSSAVTHTYTPVKTNIFPFFPQAYMENFEKCAKTQKLKQKKYIVPCYLWLAIGAPCGQDITPYGSKPIF